MEEMEGNKERKQESVNEFSIEPHKTHKKKKNQAIHNDRKKDNQKKQRTETKRDNTNN